MSRASLPSHSGPRHPPELTELCQQAEDRLKHALERATNEIAEEVDEAARAVVRLRDALIEQLRQDPSAQPAGRLPAALNSVNAALSLVVGVKYPAAGIHRKLLEQARDALENVRKQMRET